MKHYTVYSRKTDEIVAVGTSSECARRLRITTASFRSLVSRHKRGIPGKYEFIVEDKPYDEEDGLEEVTPCSKP